MTFQNKHTFLELKTTLISRPDKFLIKNLCKNIAKVFLFLFLATMSLSVKGKIQQILKPESGVSRAGKEWSKQEFVIETEDQYPKKICFTPTILMLGKLINRQAGMYRKRHLNSELKIFHRNRKITGMTYRFKYMY